MKEVLTKGNRTVKVYEKYPVLASLNHNGEELEKGDVVDGSKFLVDRKTDQLTPLLERVPDPILGPGFDPKPVAASKPAETK